MNDTNDYYLNRLYPLQDRVLHMVNEAQTDFYLSGGTALSRGYLNHRFSDDLDLFMNTATTSGEDRSYRLGVDRVIDALARQPDWTVTVTLRGQYFTRIVVSQESAQLRVELINDVIAHIGEISYHPVLGRLDNPENILANKLTALRDREEPRDVADVWGICTKLGLSIERAITDARRKSSGLYHADIARRLISTTRADWEAVRWIHPPDPDQ